MTELIDFVLHFDDQLAAFVAQYGVWTYAILFAIIFCETGLVVTPILPGDSLLFAVGVFCGKPGQPLNIWTATVLLSIAAILGDTVNYHVGRYLGPRILSGKLSRWLNPKHLERTHWFFERYGAKTIVIARFVPIVRTFAPFIAGVGKMNYSRFLTYNVLGGIFWVVVCTQAGWWLAGWSFVEERFEVIVLLIVGISLLPALVEFLIHRYGRKPSVIVSESSIR
jgi:membrane-associated protein